MNLAIHSSFDKSRISGEIPHDLHQMISDSLSYRVTGYQFTQAFKNGNWDGKKRLYTYGSGSGSFPTGLMDQVVEILTQYTTSNTLSVPVLYTQEDPVYRGPILHSVKWGGPELRPYQEEAVARAISRKRGIVHIGTGGGKMMCAAAIFARIGRKGIIFVNSEEALRDTVDEFNDCMPDVDVGRWSSSSKRPGFITVCTIQSMYTKNDNPKARRAGKSVLPPPEPLRELLASVDVLIVDECHHLGSDQYYKITQSCPATYRFGQTGTPARPGSGDLLLIACTGPILFSKPVKELQDEGYLIPSEVRFYYSPAPSKYSDLDIMQMDSATKYRECIVDNAERNQLIVDLIHEHRGRGLLCTVSRVEHGEKLAEMANVPFIVGDRKKMSAAQRKAVQEKLNSGELTAVVATTIYDESVNIPNLNVLINAGAMSPENAQTQRHGRILRRCSTTDEPALFIDFYDDWDTKLLLHSNKRAKYMRKEGHAVKLANR